MTEDIITPIDDKEALHPNMLKCINCGEPAEFHVNGTRVCSDEVCVGKYCYNRSSREQSPPSLDETIWALERLLKALKEGRPVSRLTVNYSVDLQEIRMNTSLSRYWRQTNTSPTISDIEWKLGELYEQQTRRDLEFLQEE